MPSKSTWSISSSANRYATTPPYHTLTHRLTIKQHTHYVNELITFYLDTVIHELDSNPSSRTTLSETYSTYRILTPPKPTYHQFITDNALPVEWWQARLRLLHLLGSSQPGTSSYDVPTILTRLAPYENELVPEMIILHGRQHQHQEALRLLTHGLGDFDTAISYCLYGYSSIFRARVRPGTLPVAAADLPPRAEQSRLFGFLLQEFLPHDPEQGIVRLEFLGGELLYAMRVKTHGRFNLCPSPVCNPDEGDGICEVPAHEPVAAPPVEFFARGVGVDVAWIGGATVRATGNSFATPHMTGICALILGKHPELTPFQLKSVLYLTADNVGGGA